MWYMITTYRTPSMWCFRWDIVILGKCTTPALNEEQRKVKTRNRKFGLEVSHFKCSRQPALIPLFCLSVARRRFSSTSCVRMCNRGFPVEETLFCDATPNTYNWVLSWADQYKRPLLICTRVQPSPVPHVPECFLNLLSDLTLDGATLKGSQTLLGGSWWSHLPCCSSSSSSSLVTRPASIKMKGQALSDWTPISRAVTSMRLNWSMKFLPKLLMQTLICVNHHFKPQSQKITSHLSRWRTSRSLDVDFHLDLLCLKKA